MIPSIEALFALFQKPVEIVRFDAVIFRHVPLGLVPEVLDPGDVILPVGKEL